MEFRFTWMRVTGMGYQSSLMQKQGLSKIVSMFHSTISPEPHLRHAREYILPNPNADVIIN
jgi:hypothetical protein